MHGFFVLLFPNMDNIAFSNDQSLDVVDIEVISIDDFTDLTSSNESDQESCPQTNEPLPQWFYDYLSKPVVKKYLDRLDITNEEALRRAYESVKKKALAKKASKEKKSFSHKCKKWVGISLIMVCLTALAISILVYTHHGKKNDDTEADDATTTVAPRREHSIEAEPASGDNEPVVTEFSPSTTVPIYTTTMG